MPSVAIEARAQISQTAGPQRGGANSAGSGQDGFSALVDNNLADATHEPASSRSDRPTHQDRGQDNSHGRIKRADGPDLSQEPLPVLTTNAPAQSSDKAAADDKAEASAVIAPTVVATDTDVVATEADASPDLGGAEQDRQTSVSGTPQIAIAVQPSPVTGIEAGSGSEQTEVAAIAPTAAAPSPSIAAGPAKTAAAALARVAMDTGDAALPQPKVASDQILTPAVAFAEIASATPDNGAIGQSPLPPNDSPAIVPNDNSALADNPATATTPTASTAPASPPGKGPVTLVTAAETPDDAVDAPQSDRRASQQFVATARRASLSSGDPNPGAKTAEKIKPTDGGGVASDGPVATESAQKPEAKTAESVKTATNVASSDTPIATPDHPAAEKPSHEVAATLQDPIPDQPRQNGFGSAHHQMAAAPSAVTQASQLTAVLANTTPVPIHGLAVEIAANAQIGRSRFEIRLDPPELGRIDIHLDVDRQGQVTSHLFVEKSGTLDLLRRDAQQLDRALQDAGLKTSDNSLQFSLRDQSQSGRNSDNGREPAAQRLIVVDEDAVAVETAGRNYGRMLGQRGGIDIRV